MPIDIATGRLELDHVDASVPGHVPLVWDRRYSTALIDQPPSALGLGWTCRYFATLRYVDGQFEYFTPNGGAETFANPENAFARGQVLRNLGAFKELFREGQSAVVRTWDIDTGEIWRFVFTAGTLGEAWRLAAIEDVTSVQGLDLRWSASGQLLEVKQRLERRALLPRYDRDGRIEQVHLLGADGQHHPLVSYEYGDDGTLVEVKDAAGFADRFEYDNNGRCTREINKDGGVFHNRYDSQGRCVLTTGLGHYHEKRLRFIDSICTTEVTNSCGEKTVYQNLPSGQAVSITDALGGQRTTDYDTHGRIVVETDATGSATLYTYDASGNRDSTTDALGHVTEFEFNDHHQPLSMLDAAGNTWHRAYDKQHRLVASMDPLGGQWRFNYDAEGNVCEVINAKGDRKHQQFQNGVLQSTTDWMAHATHYRFDAFGRVVERTGPLGERTTFRYDAKGNATGVKLPDGAELVATYDHAGNLTLFIDGNGHATRWRYGPCSRLMERTDPVGGTVRYVWGSERGRLDAVINEKNERYSFERDEAGRIVKEVSFDGAVRRFKLDAEGHSMAYTNANEEVIAIQRDALHRVIGQRLPDGEAITYAFNPLGHLINAVNSDIAVTIDRDALGRITKEVQGEEWVNSRYDMVGNLIQTKTSQGHETKYEHDANGHMSALVTAGDKRISFERDASGHERARQMPGGARLTQRFDAMGRLLEQRVNSTANAFNTYLPAGDLVRRDYRYDRNGALTRITDGRWGQVDYAYDPAERLLSSIRKLGAAGSAGGPSEQFAYDATGNLTRMRASGAHGANTEAETGTDETLEYGPGNRLLRKGTTRYEYDGEGRRTRKIEDEDSNAPKVWTFEWNALDRLRQITRPDGDVWQYRYDALARRVSKACVVEATDKIAAQPPHQPSKHERFVWDQDVVVHQLQQEKPAVTWLFESTNFAPLAKVKDRQIQVIVTNHLGTPCELVGEDGVMVPLPPGGAWDSGVSEGLCPIGFQGQWKDFESQLAYNRYRYYDQNSARYISEDPIGLIGGLNFGNYVSNSINWIDPLGLNYDCPGKRGPNKSKDAPHNKKIAEIAARIEDAGGVIISGGQKKAEQLIPTPGGVAKKGRRPDIIYMDEHGYIKAINVGKTEADGKTPVKRERIALSDLNEHAGLDTDFEPYTP